MSGGPALVTGATGGLGLALVQTLSDAGWTVRANGRSAAARERLQGLGAEVVLGDLLTSDLKALCSGVDTVFHAAGQSSPWGEERAFRRANVEATRDLLAAARNSGAKRFVFVSSPSIYTALRDRPNLTETDPPADPPMNAYARTKLMAERLVRAANTEAFRTVAVRPRALIGPDDAVVLPRILRVVERGRFPLFRDGRALAELTDVRDGARALMLAAERIEAVAGGAVNIAGGRAVSIKSLALKLGDALKRSFRFVSIPMAVARPLASASQTISAILPGSPEPVLTPYTLATLAYTQTFDLTLAREALGYTPQHDAVESALALAPAMAARAARP
jgi:nucleoside-diphosphate-sugar epimerase